MKLNPVIKDIQWYYSNGYISARVYPPTPMVLQLYESELYHVRNYYYLVTVFIRTYENTSIYQTDKGCILIAILSFQFKI